VIQDWHKAGTLVALSAKYGVPDAYFKSASAKAQQGRFDRAPFEADVK
jgi:polar amino acid transport system substrate-binding protein